MVLVVFRRKRHAILLSDRGRQLQRPSRLRVVVLVLCQRIEVLVPASGEDGGSYRFGSYRSGGPHLRLKPVQITGPLRCADNALDVHSRSRGPFAQRGCTSWLQDPQCNLIPTRTQHAAMLEKVLRFKQVDRRRLPLGEFARESTAVLTESNRRQGRSHHLVRLQGRNQERSQACSNRLSSMEFHGCVGGCERDITGHLGSQQ